MKKTILKFDVNGFVFTYSAEISNRDDGFKFLNIHCVVSHNDIEDNLMYSYITDLDSINKENVHKVVNDIAESFDMSLNKDVFIRDLLIFIKDEHFYKSN